MPPLSLPYSVQIIQALGPSLVALVVGSIAAGLTYRQFQNSKDKLRLDLFEKRYAIYREVTAVLATTLSHGDISYQEIVDYSRSTRGAEFLFGMDVEEYLKELHDKLLKYSFCNQQIALGAGADPAYQQHVEQAYEIALYLDEQLRTNARGIFDVYLSFSHLK